MRDLPPLPHTEAPRETWAAEGRAAEAIRLQTIFGHHAETVRACDGRHDVLAFLAFETDKPPAEVARIMGHACPAHGVEQ